MELELVVRRVNALVVSAKQLPLNWFGKMFLAFCFAKGLVIPTRLELVTF